MSRASRAFSDRGHGDLRHGDRTSFSLEHRVSAGWATVNQVHGPSVVVVAEPGPHGDGDALVTSTPGVPVAVFTADCLGLVFESESVVAVAHVGWRGLASGIVEATHAAMVDLGASPQRVTAGPGIRPCCFEVGPEVTSAFPSSVTTTSWGTPSVDLVAEVRQRLGDIPFAVMGGCTKCDGRYLSYRNGDRDARMVAMGWLNA